MEKSVAQVLAATCGVWSSTFLLPSDNQSREAFICHWLGVGVHPSDSWKWIGISIIFDR